MLTETGTVILLGVMWFRAAYQPTYLRLLNQDNFDEFRQQPKEDNTAESIYIKIFFKQQFPLVVPEASELQCTQSNGVRPS